MASLIIRNIDADISANIKISMGTSKTRAGISVSSISYELFLLSLCVAIRLRLKQLSLLIKLFKLKHFSATILIGSVICHAKTIHIFLFLLLIFEAPLLSLPYVVVK